MIIHRNWRQIDQNSLLQSYIRLIPAGLNYSTMESKTNAVFGGVSFYFSIKNIYHGLHIPQKEDRQA